MNDLRKSVLALMAELVVLLKPRELTRGRRLASFHTDLPAETLRFWLSRWCRGGDPGGPGTAWFRAGGPRDAALLMAQLQLFRSRKWRIHYDARTIAGL